MRSLILVLVAAFTVSAIGCSGGNPALTGQSLPKKPAAGAKADGGSKLPDVGPVPPVIRK